MKNLLISLCLLVLTGCGNCPCPDKEQLKAEIKEDTKKEAQFYQTREGYKKDCQALATCLRIATPPIMESTNYNYYTENNGNLRIFSCHITPITNEFSMYETDYEITKMLHMCQWIRTGKIK